MDKQENKNYDLSSEAVEALAGANEDNTPQYSEAELKKYRSKSGIKIPRPVKLLFVKAWFAGAVCYFVLWGLGMYVPSLVDMMFVLGAALGMVTDLLANNVLRFIETTPGGNDDYMLFPQKGLVGFGLNLLYGFVLLFCVYTLYDVINVVITSITGNTDTLPLGVEPVLFGVFYMGFDMLFIAMKWLFKRILADAKQAAGRTNDV